MAVTLLLSRDDRQECAICWVVEQRALQRAGGRAASASERVSRPSTSPLQKFWKYFSTDAGNARIPGPGVSVPDARIPCMTTASDDTGQHPVTSAIAAVSHQLRKFADLPLWTLPAAETDANLTALAALRHQITELELRVAHQADRLDLGAHAGVTDTSSYWANAPRQTRRDASAAWTSRTPWTTTTSRSGRRWPPGRSPKSRRW